MHFRGGAMSAHGPTGHSGNDCVQDVGPNRPKRLDAITGLKIVALLLVFYWHSPLPKSGVPDLGARCCELFFVASGFLVAYSRHGKFPESFRGTLEYVLNKIRHAYPVYLVSLVLSVAWMFLSDGVEWLRPDYLCALPFHIILCQSWISGIAMLYNGAAWFLSSLLVCYALAPVIDWALGRLSKRIGEMGGAAFLMLFSAAARLLVDFGAQSNPVFFSVSLHTFPPIRLLEFSMAYGAGALFLIKRVNVETARSGPKKLALSAIELAVVVAMVYFIVHFNDTWPRVYYVILFVPVVFLFAYSGGVVSRLLSLRVFGLMDSVELEFYLLHQPVIRVISAFLAIFGISWVKKTAALAFVVTIAISIILAYGLRSHRRTRKSHEHQDELLSG